MKFKDVAFPILVILFLLWVLDNGTEIQAIVFLLFAIYIEVYMINNKPE